MYRGVLMVLPDGRWILKTFHPEAEEVLNPFGTFVEGEGYWLIRSRDQMLLEVAESMGIHVSEDILRELVAARDHDAHDGHLHPDLYPYQRVGVRWLTGHPRGLLADSPGLGKSCQALLALPRDAPAIIVCPASVKGVWVDESRKWTPGRTASLLAGRRSFRAPAPGESVILNWDILPNPPPPLLPGTVLVLDEVHASKNPAALRSRAAAKLARAVDVAWGLTGTPLLNRPSELGCILNALGEGVLERAFGSWGTFARLIGAREEERGTAWSGVVHPDFPKKLRRVMLRRRREDVLPDLPAKRFQTIPVHDLPAGLKGRLDKALREWNEWVARSPAMKREVPHFSSIARVRADLARAKTGRAMELIETYEDAGEPLVVFSAHREPIDVIGGRGGWEKITGLIDSDERTEIVSRFQAGELRGVALTIGAGREGITLTRASHMLFIDLAWTPGWNSQAEDRLCRIGQVAEGLLYQIMVADHPVDVRLAEILREKEALIEATVEAASVMHGEDPSVLPGRDRVMEARNLIQRREREA